MRVGQLRAGLTSLGFVAVVLMASSAAQAATINLETTARVSDVPEVTDDRFFDSSVLPIVGAKTATADASNAGASVVATTTTDLAAGTIKNKLTPTVSNTEFFGFGSAMSALTGQVQVLTGGSITFLFDLAGFWNLTAVPTTAMSPNPQLTNVTVDARFQVLGPGGADPLEQFITSSSALNVSIDELLASTIVVAPGDTIEIQASLLTNVQGASGMVDFSNTASLGYFSPDGVALNFPDDGFLSSATVVPLPLSGILLAGAVATAVGAGWRRSSA